MTPRAARSDALRTRNKLLDAAGTLLISSGTAFTLPDLARESAVSTATTYRHFADVHAVFDAYLERLVKTLVAILEDVPDQADALSTHSVMCRRWIEGAIGWADAARHLRSARGYLQRTRSADEALIVRFSTILKRAISRLIDEGAIPDLDLEFAELIWISLFDERVVYDLVHALHWSPERVAAQLTGSLLATWRHLGDEIVQA